MTNQFKVSIYIRVSTSKQANEGDSLDEQEKELKKFCEYKNYLIHKTHIEAGRSAKDTNRPEYQRLMRDIEAGKINAVVVKKLDRLSRSLLDFEGFMVTAQKHNVEFISLKENFDTTTAMGKAMLRVALVFAQLEREQTSERVKDVMLYRAEQGLQNGGSPAYGYDIINTELVPQRLERKIVELMFNVFAETRSITDTAKILNEAGHSTRKGKPWDKRVIDNMLQNPLYIGKIRWCDKEYSGIHQPIIGQKKFDDIQKIFKEQRYVINKHKTNAVLQSILFCGECGSPMTPSHSWNRTKRKYYYYRCTKSNSSEKGMSNCKASHASFKSAESRCLNLLVALTQEQQFKILENPILKHNQIIEREFQKIKADIVMLENKLEATTAKKDRYLDSLISSEFLSSERKKINSKLEELELEEKQIKAGIYKQQFEFSQKEDESIDLIALKASLIDFRKDYETFPPQQLRKYLITTIQEIKYYPDKLKIQFRKLPWPVEFQA